MVDMYSIHGLVAVVSRFAVKLWNLPADTGIVEYIDELRTFRESFRAWLLWRAPVKLLPRRISSFGASFPQAVLSLTAYFRLASYIALLPIAEEIRSYPPLHSRFLFEGKQSLPLQLHFRNDSSKILNT